MKSSLIFALLLAVTASSNAADTHWGYEGKTGPAKWGALSEEYSACMIGKNQSPINIKNAVEADLPPIKFNYRPSTLRTINNGHTYQINYNEGSSITVDGTTFALKQLHFHSPSENQIDGRSFPLEAHLVHADQDGNLAVVALLFESGKENPVLVLPWQYMPATAGAEQVHEDKIDLNSLLPKDRSYYRFSGSLTTPPCTEGVRWFVLKTSASASAAQIAKFESTIGHPNNRPIQHAYARVPLK